MNIGMICDLADTGFGRVGRELARRWIAAGHDMRIIGINFLGREGAVAQAIKDGGDGAAIKAAWDRVSEDPVLSRATPASIGGDGMGHDLTEPFVRGQLFKDWQPERVVLVADPVAALYRMMADHGAMATVPSYNYVPIEGADLSVFWRTIWAKVQPVAMSQFGKAQIDALMGTDDTPYIAHGISPAFHRITPERPEIGKDDVAVTSKAEAKAMYGLTGKTVILRTDRFVPRKAYPEYFEVIRRVIGERPEVVFVLHCSVVDEGGILAQFVADLPGARASDNGWHHPQVLLTRAHDTFRGLTDAQLAILYNAADIYASTSYSEGFGLTLAEAAACAVPVVANDFGAIPEAVGLGALLVPPHHTVRTQHAHSWAAVDLDGFTDALMMLVDDPRLRADLGAKGEAHVSRFDWDAAALAFLRLMED